MNDLSGQIIASALDIHRTLGPGLNQDAYEEALAHEFTLRGLLYRRHSAQPVVYKNRKIADDRQLDFVVSAAVVLKILTVDLVMPQHHAELLSNLKLSGHSLGLIINFRAALLKNGVKRIVHNYQDENPLTMIRKS